MIQFVMRCNRSIDGEQQVNDQSQGGRVALNDTREFTLISTRPDGTPFEPHVQYATMSATLLFPSGFDSAEYEQVRRGRTVEVTLRVVEDGGGDAPPAPAPTGEDATGSSGGS